MAVTGMQAPDFRTISDFRNRHLAELRELFVQVLQLCQKAGLVKLGHVALDGTKVKANASKHKAMSYGRMKKAEAELEAIVSGWFKPGACRRCSGGSGARSISAKRNCPIGYGTSNVGLEKIREARARLEAEARAQEPVPEGTRRTKAAVRVGRERTSPGPLRIRLNRTSRIPRAES